jgi:hypothetical protein
MNDLAARLDQFCADAGALLVFGALICGFFAFCCACEELYDWIQRRRQS